MALILGGRAIEVPGLETVSWLDDPHVPRATDGSARTTWIRAIVLHTVEGKRGPLADGIKPSRRDLAYARYQANTPRAVSWDYTLDTDGSVAVSNDPLEHYTWHAGQVNAHTLGIELVQERDGTLYRGQLDALVLLVDALTRELGIQRQVPARLGKPVAGVLSRLLRENGAGRDVCGIYGHRNATSNRGAGDPGDHVFSALMTAGYEAFDVEQREDLAAWSDRQRALGIAPDGIPGPGTREALKRAGHTDGIWVERGGDGVARSTA